MRAASLFSVALSAALMGTVVAQVPQGTQLQRTSLTIYRDTPEGKKVDFVITGTSATNVNAQNVIDQFEMKSYHNGDPKAVQIIAQAPQCEVDLSNNVASDAGPLQVFTPTTNLFVQGVGFRFTQANHFLIISNQVETRVLKSLLKSSVLSAPRTNAAPQAPQFIKIFAEHGEFNFDSNVVDYSGHVHMIDPQLDLTSDLLTIRFTTNGAVESMLALHNVVLTTPNNGRATGNTGFYYVTNKNEMMQLTGNSKWRNGSEEADAEDFTYDSERHILNGIGHVRVRWPNATAKSDLIPTVPPVGVGANGYRELFADFATMKFPPTNGPVESMFAHGHVIIVNQADQSRAMADRAEYQRTTDRVELAGSPAWWTDAMRVEGDTLTAELSNKTYHARKNSHFKMRTGGAGTNQPAAGAGHPTNQWVYISSYDMEYQTNQANFYGAVETQFVENGKVRDTLDSALLTINLTNSLAQSAFSSGDVHGETAPDTNGIVKTITCQALNAYRDVKTALMKSIDAHTNVIIEERGGALTNRLAADTVTAQFSPVTNRIDEAVAIHNVVIDQIKSGRIVHATSDHAVYKAGTNDEVKLTGAPLAHKDNSFITDADYMVWQPKANTFQAFGKYKIVSVKEAAQK